MVTYSQPLPHGLLTPGSPTALVHTVSWGATAPCSQGRHPHRKKKMRLSPAPHSKGLSSRSHSQLGGTSVRSSPLPVLETFHSDTQSPTGHLL